MLTHTPESAFQHGTSEVPNRYVRDEGLGWWFTPASPGNPCSQRAGSYSEQLGGETCDGAGESVCLGVSIRKCAEAASLRFAL